MKQILLCVTILVPFLMWGQDKKTSAILKSAMMASEKNISISYKMAAKYKLPTEIDTIYNTAEVAIERLKGDTISEGKVRVKRNNNLTFVYNGSRFLMLRGVDSVAVLVKTPTEVAKAFSDDGFLAFETLYEYILPARWNTLFQDSSIKQITDISLDTVDKHLCHHIDVAYKDDSTLQNRLVHYWIDSKTFILRKYIYEVDYNGQHQFVQQSMTEIRENPYFLANERILRPINMFATDVPRGYKFASAALVGTIAPEVIDTMAAIRAKDSGIIAPVVMIDTTKTDTLKLNLPPVNPMDTMKLNITPVTPLKDSAVVVPISPTPEGKKDSLGTVQPSLEVKKDSLGNIIPNLEVKKDSAGVIPPNLEVKKDTVTVPIPPSLEGKKDSLGKVQPNMDLKKDSTGMIQPKVELKKDTVIVPVPPSLEGKKDSIGTVSPSIEIKKDTITVVNPPIKDTITVKPPITTPSNVPTTPLQKGENAPNFSLSTTDGRIISLLDLRNKVVLINFWDRSCDTCINILPVLQNLQNRYADRGFVVLELYTSDVVKDTFHTLSNVKYTIGLNAQQVATEYHVQRYPTLYLIDREGRICDVEAGRVGIKEEDWNAKIESCLQK